MQRDQKLEAILTKTSLILPLERTASLKGKVYSWNSQEKGSIESLSERVVEMGQGSWSESSRFKRWSSTLEQSLQCAEALFPHLCNGDNTILPAVRSFWRTTWEHVEESSSSFRVFPLKNSGGKNFLLGRWTSLLLFSRDLYLLLFQLKKKVLKHQLFLLVFCIFPGFSCTPHRGSTCTK